MAHVYILASAYNGTLYVGSTARDLNARVAEHKSGQGSEFTAKYSVFNLVWFEQFDELSAAQAAEFRIKKWKRNWKINLIEKMNPAWKDLSMEMLQ